MMEGNKAYIEHAFQNGYEKGKKDAAKEIVKILEDYGEDFNIPITIIKQKYNLE